MDTLLTPYDCVASLRYTCVPLPPPPSLLYPLAPVLSPLPKPQALVSCTMCSSARVGHSVIVRWCSNGGSPTVGREADSREDVAVSVLTGVVIVCRDTPGARAREALHILGRDGGRHARADGHGRGGGDDRVG